MASQKSEIHIFQIHEQDTIFGEDIVIHKIIELTTNITILTNK